MKLQKQKTREFHGKEYFRYAVVIPQAEIEKLGWKEDQELAPKSVGQKLIIMPSKWFLIEGDRRGKDTQVFG